MGNYTELVLKIEIRKDTPAEVRNVLRHMFSKQEPEPEPETLPDHPFFKCARWVLVGRSGSYYHHPESVSSMIGDCIFSRSDLKNYDSEIEKFLDWIGPYLASCPGCCIGWKWYEEDDGPTLLYAPENRPCP